MTKKPRNTYLYVGTFTRPAPYVGDTNGEGIYVYAFDPDSGTLAYLSETHGIDNPSYLTVDRSGECLYANSEIFGWDEGLVKAYAIDRETGALSYLNMQPSRGSLTSYISVEQTNQYALVTNYWTGSVVLFRIQDDGSLSPVVDKNQHNGSGPNPERQEGPHTHCVLMDPTNTYAFVTDLGLDKIFCYRLDLASGRLVLHGVTDLPPESGPRHFVFHPNGGYAYVICELSSTVIALAYDDATGALTPFQTVPTLPADFDGESHCSDIHVTASGRFLYAANRGHDTLAIFAIDAATGALTALGHELTRGKTPRNFVIDPTDAFLLVANQDSDTIVTFRIDQESGQLTPTENVADVPTPVCLKFLRI